MLPKKLKWEDSYLKYLVLYIFFMILLVFGIALLFTSNAVSRRKLEYVDVLSGVNAEKESIALTFTSFLISLVAFIGICATYNKSKLILILFCVLLIFLITIEILCTYVSLRYNYKFKKNEIHKKLQDLTLNYKWTDQSSDTLTDQLVNGIQSFYNCCGAQSYESWDILRPTNLSSDLYPCSCCHHFCQLINSTINWCSLSQVNITNSCFNSIDERIYEIKKSVAIMAGITITNSVIKVIGIPIVYYFGRQLSENFIV